MPCSYMARIAPLVVVALVLELAACRSAPQLGSETSIRLAVGDSLQTVQAALNVRDVPKKAVTATGVPETQMILSQRGIWVFFDSANRALQYRFDAPFGGNIYGARIGASIDQTKAALGSPVRAIPSLAIGQSYLFQVNGATVRCDFDSRGILQTIRVLQGALTFIEPQSSLRHLGAAHTGDEEFVAAEPFGSQGNTISGADMASIPAQGMEFGKRRTEDHQGMAIARKGWELAKQEINRHQADFTQKRCQDVEAQWIKIKAMMRSN